MTFGRRLTEDLEVVHSQDPALADVDATVMENYLLTRDISLLPKSALATAKILRCTPLLVKYEHLATMATEAYALRAIFRHHVCGARGPDTEWLRFETSGGRRQLTEESAEEATLDFMGEIAAVIVQSASKRGTSAPFSPPDTWRQNRRLTLRAKVLADLAKDIQQDASSESNVSETTEKM